MTATHQIQVARAECECRSCRSATVYLEVWGRLAHGQGPEGWCMFFFVCFKYEARAVSLQSRLVGARSHGTPAMHVGSGTSQIPQMRHSVIRGCRPALRSADAALNLKESVTA
eukprot:s1156_g15.t1